MTTSSHFRPRLGSGPQHIFLLGGLGSNNEIIRWADPQDDVSEDPFETRTPLDNVWDEDLYHTT